MASRSGLPRPASHRRCLQSGWCSWPDKERQPEVAKSGLQPPPREITEIVSREAAAARREQNPDSVLRVRHSPPIAMGRLVQQPQVLEPIGHAPAAEAEAADYAALEEPAALRRLT